MIALGFEKCVPQGLKPAILLADSICGLKPALYFGAFLARDPEGAPPCPCYKAPPDEFFRSL